MQVYLHQGAHCLLRLQGSQDVMLFNEHVSTRALFENNTAPFPPPLPPLL